MNEGEDGFGEDPDDEYEGEECPVCGAIDCANHVVVIFVDGYPHDDFGALTLEDWNEIARSLQIRLVDAWLEGRSQVDGPKSLAALLPTLNDIDRRRLLREVSGEETPDDPGNFAFEVSELLDANDQLPDVERVEDVMREALDSLRGMSEQSSSVDNGPCTFVADRIYSSNPEAMVRRFKMRLGL
ncbi:MAG: hypothetical protein IPK27_05575 [Rhodanobacteraceae bacterium]|nr:hypothetical protein [Rhodanobacteraceae bacterium]